MFASRLPTVVRSVVITAFLAMAGAAMAHPPWGIVVSSTGVVYFSDLETVWKIDRDGKKSVFRASVGGRHVHELAIDHEDNLYGPDYIYEPGTEKYFLGVWKMTPDGKETVLQRPIDTVMSGVSIWRDRGGNMYSIEQNNHTKERTLLLRRTPAGAISTLAGGAYGQVDGKGTAARFGSVTAITFGPDGNIYLTDDASVRRVSLDGTVKTVARNLAARTSEDKPTLFGGADTVIMGLAVDFANNIYVADSGNRRLLKIGKDERVSVVYRTDPPFFPTGVFATPTGDLYVLEFSYTPPGTTNNPRVRKMSLDGQRIVNLAGPGQEHVSLAPPNEGIRTRFNSLLAVANKRLPYVVLLVLVAVVTLTFVVWRTRRKHRA